MMGMILEVADWKFDIDMTTIMEYSSTEAKNHCDCAYCRNFYASIDRAYPNLRPFLAQFGLDIEAPDELMTFDMENRMDYLGEYAVAGVILETGSSPICVDGISIAPKENSQINCALQGPVFFLSLDWVRLPWILDEPMNEVVSSANYPSFLKKMWNKLLGRQPKSDITS